MDRTVLSHKQWLGGAGRQKTRPCLKRLDGLPLQNTSSTRPTDPETTDKPTLHLQGIRDSKFFSPNDCFGHKDPMLTICSQVSYTSIHLHKSSPVIFQNLHHWPGNLNQAVGKPAQTKAGVDIEQRSKQTSPHSSGSCPTK